MTDESRGLTAEDIMQVSVRTVSTETTLPELERDLLKYSVGGFPVVDEGRRLLGVVSHSDVLRAICKERGIASTTSDFYRDATGFHEVKMESFQDIADRLGERLEGLSVKEVMVPKPRTVHLRQTIREIANEFATHQIHRLPVVDTGLLVGIVTTVDLVRLIADHRLIERS